MENREKEKDFLKFQVTRKVTNLYKNFLFILEDLQDEDYNVSDESYKRSRKRVLDHGNDSIREIEEYLDKFDIRLK
jgi:predicted esterase YcpF (UPF0227 family)